VRDGGYCSMLQTTVAGVCVSRPLQAPACVQANESACTTRTTQTPPNRLSSRSRRTSPVIYTFLASIRGGRTEDTTEEKQTGRHMSRREVRGCQHMSHTERRRGESNR
jgi:hypothetical protein